MIEITEIRGKKEVIDNINKVEKVVENSLLRSLSNASDLLRDRAIQNVFNWAKMPGKSLQGGSITDKSRWIIEPIDYNEIKLSCTSEHAKVVEFGGISPGEKKIAYEITGKNAWPIGKQQGIVNEFTSELGIPRVSFRTQHPMSYFRSAKDDEECKSMMRESIKKDIWSYIIGVI